MSHSSILTQLPFLCQYLDRRSLKAVSVTGKEERKTVENILGFLREIWVDASPDHRQILVTTILR